MQPHTHTDMIGWEVGGVQELDGRETGERVQSSAGISLRAVHQGLIPLPSGTYGLLDGGAYDEGVALSVVLSPESRFIQGQALSNLLRQKPDWCV